MTSTDPREVLTRPARDPDLVLRYGDHDEQLIDVHLPAGASEGAPAPVVVLLHGGYWRQAFDRKHDRPLAEALADEGFVVLTPEYRRVGGDGGWPHTFRDVAAALLEIPSLVAELPVRVAPGLRLVGHSAGGHLAIWAALQPDAPDVSSVVALAPVADLYEAHRRRLGEGAVEALMGGGPDDLPDEYAAADAARLLPGDVPITVVHGALDDRVPVDLSRRLAEVEGVEYVELPDVEHFGVIDPRSSAWPTVLAAVQGS